MDEFITNLIHYHISTVSAKAAIAPELKVDEVEAIVAQHTMVQTLIDTHGLEISTEGIGVTTFKDGSTVKRWRCLADCANHLKPEDRSC